MSTKPQLKVVFYQVGTPTYILNLADAILVAIEDYKKEIINCQLSSQSHILMERTVNYSKSGIYHFLNEGVCFRFDFTKMIEEIAGNAGCGVHPFHSDKFPSYVKRPAYSALDKTKLNKKFGVFIPY